MVFPKLQHIDDLEKVYMGYRNTGGRLTKEGFNLVSQVCRTGFPKVDVNSNIYERNSLKCQIAQVNHMGRFTNLAIAPKEYLLYILLQNEQLLGCHNEREGAYKEGLSDQNLMAEILKLTNPEGYMQFISKYPNIFHK